ncbi:MAG: hypothetical protein KDB53_13135, partial [Planctomycetes bacterium]|nr:hypothetical protein [Planctomycetota bacterium]
MTRRRRRRLVLIGTPLLLLVVARVFFFELHRVEGVSMWPGINPRGGAEWVLVGRWGEPEAGRLAIFRAPDDSSVVKRVAATGGQTVYFTGGDLKVDSEFVARSLDEILATRVPVIHLDDLALRERRDGPVYEDGLGRRAMVPIRGRIALSDAGGMLKLTDPEGATELRIPAANFMDDHLASSGRLVRGDQVVRDL